MTIQTACQTASQPVSQPLSTTDLRRPNCPRCGSMLLVAEQSVFNPNGHIRHTWSCHDCGNEFVTSVRVFPRQA